MSRNLTRVWPLLVLAFASEVWALGLGDIRLSSALNEPLRAEIELLSATPEELDNLKVALASQDTFARYGLDRPLFLQSIAFRVIKSGGIDGNVITAVSQDPVTEPFITFLVEATWSRGRLLREYTLLLDPPTFAPPPVQESATAVTAPRQTTQADSGRIERQIERQPEPQASAPPSRPSQPAPAPAPSRSEPLDPASFDSSGGGNFHVQRGHTLWQIASQVRPDSRLTMNQTMLAIFEANPEAFAGNINIMSAGAVLRIPSADEIFSISRGDALREAQRQNNEWGGVMPVADISEPSLTLVPPDDDQTGYDEGARTSLGDDADVDEDPTETRIRDIEETLAAHQDSLIEIQDNELAALRQELARLRGEEYIEPDVLDVDADAVLDDDTTIDTTLDPDLIDDDLLADDTVADDIVIDDTDAADDVDTAPAPVVVSQPRDEPGIVDRALDFVSGFWGILIGGLLVVMGVLVWFARRAARSDDEESTGVWDALDADDLDGESLASTERLRALAREDDTAIVVVEQETAPTREPEEEPAGAETIEAPAAPQAPVVEEDALEATGENVGLEDTFSSETAINLDQSDPVAEADFHMAYGLYDQAADLINGALAVEPEREDLLAKLCEIYFVWGNRDAFVDASSRLRTVIGDESNTAWDKIVIMGQQIAADHEMFSGVGPAPTREVDLSFEGALDEESELDMDLAAAGTGESEIIDLGDEAGADDGGDQGLDMLFDTAETEAPEGLEDTEAATADVPAAEETGLTAEMPTAETDLGDATGEVPAIDETGEVPAAEDTGLTAEIPEAAEETGLTAEMPTAETPMTATDATGETPTIEEQFRVLEETGELPAISIGDDEATRLASLDDDDMTPDSTGEIEIDDLGLDLDDLAKTGLGADLDDTAERDVLPVDDDLVATATNEDVDDDLAATGRNLAVDTDAGTGIHEALDVGDALAASNEADIAATDETSRNRALDDTGIGAAIDTSLLDATGQTQVLTDDMAVETASEIEDVISDQDRTLLAPMDDDSDGLPEDAETLLAPLDDEDSGDDESTVLVASDEDFDFAKTEALPKDVFTGNDPIEDTGALPGIAETDVDLDLDDLTAALRVSEVDDTVDQLREDATVEHPRPSGNDVDLSVGDTDDDEDRDPTARLAPEDVSGDLHDARTMTEVGTKLDLARAYVDMGDPSGARSILEEVLDEGDDSQKQQAQQLLDSLPG